MTGKQLANHDVMDRDPEPQAGSDWEHSLGRFTISSEIVLATQPVVIDAGWMGQPWCRSQPPDPPQG